MDVERWPRCTRIPGKTGPSLAHCAVHHKESFKAFIARTAYFVLSALTLPPGIRDFIRRLADLLHEIRVVCPKRLVQQFFYECHEPLDDAAKQPFTFCGRRQV